MKRLLIPGTGSGAGNNLIRSLRAADPPFLLIGVDSDRFFLKRSTADRNYLAPPADHADFRRVLRRIVDRERIDLVLPVTDDDVAAFSRFARWLGRRLFLPASRTLARCQDKHALNVLLRSRGIPAPVTYAVRNLRGLDRLFRKFARGSRVWCRIRRGGGAIGAVPVRTADEARNWIKCWSAVRGVSPTLFTLSEFLPGRDFACQSVWREGQLKLVKTCERLAYFGTGSQPGAVSSVATLTKTVNEPRVAEICTAAVRAVDPRASGVFSIDLKEDERGMPCITEINAGRLSSGTNILDLTGKHNMAVTYARLGLGESIELAHTYDVAEDCYMLRDLDTLPSVHHADEFFEGISDINRRSHAGRQRYGLEESTGRKRKASHRP